LFVTGRLQSPGIFDVVIAHYLPVGIEKITLKVVASDNIANVDQLKAFLRQFGEWDDFHVQSFPLNISDPTKPAVLILRAGYEQPRWLYIPTYPSPDVH
jgi:hypothetical protein